MAAIDLHFNPIIVNSDQASQFTSDPYIKLLQDNEVNISMDGHSSAIDNMLNERRSCSVQHEHIYQFGHDVVKQGL
jgi:putative transposase